MEITIALLGIGTLALSAAVIMLQTNLKNLRRENDAIWREQMQLNDGIIKQIALGAEVTKMLADRA